MIVAGRGIQRQPRQVREDARSIRNQVEKVAMVVADGHWS